jgi:hypothetical protein
MPTTRPFAYNTGSTIVGTLQVGDLAIGVDPLNYAGGVGGVQWWGGPDEDLGYVIAHPTPDGSQPNQLGIPAYLGFWRSEFLTEVSFIGLAEIVSNQHGSPQTFNTGDSAKTWLNNNGYWTSYDEIIPIVYLDAGNNLSYSGSGSIWYDLEGVSNNATLINTPTYSSNYSGILSFDDVSSEYSTIPDIGDLNTWTVEVWFRLSSSITSKVSSLVTNQFNGVNKLNFSIGTNNAPSSYNLVVGFYDGAWRNTTGFAPSLNTWYQVVGTYDGSVLRQYVNGVASGGTLNYVGTPQSGGEVRLMRRWDSTVTSGNLIDGDLSIVKIYNTSLDSTQVLNNYNENAARFIDPTPTTTITPTVTVTPTITPTVTVTPTITPTITPSITRTITPTPSITPSPSTSVVFSQTFTSGVAPGSTIENAWTTFRGQLTGTYTKFDFTSSNGQGYTGITDAVKVQQIANALRTGTTGITFATTISGVTWNVGCCTCRNGGALNGAVEFANVGLCSGSSTAALRPFINNNNWGGIGSTVGAATQTLTLRFY